MTESPTTFAVREVSGTAQVIDIAGDITAQSEDVLMDAYGRANQGKVSAIVLNFTGLDYMNSGGIGLLVMLLVRAQRQHQRVLAFGLSDHYRQIFELTRLDEAVSIHDDEDAAPGRDPGREDVMSDDDRDANWAGPVSRLDVERRCPTAPSSFNVKGRRVTSPIQGFGKMWQKTYQVRLPVETVSAVDLIAMWKLALPRVLAGGQHLLRPAHRHRARRGRAAERVPAREDEAVDRRPGAVRRRGVLHADDPAGPHVRRLDHVQRPRGRRRTPSPRRRC